MPRYVCVVTIVESGVASDPLVYAYYEDAKKARLEFAISAGAILDDGTIDFSNTDDDCRIDRVVVRPKGSGPKVTDENALRMEG